jgi:Family of unknown function (DUF5670)
LIRLVASVTSDCQQKRKDTDRSIAAASARGRRRSARQRTYGGIYLFVADRNVRRRTETRAVLADDAVSTQHSVTPRRRAVLYTIAVVLIILWALGLVSSYTMGGFIHVLLVVAIVIVLLRVISGRSPV